MAETIRDAIRQFVRESPANRFPDGGAPYFDEPLVGVATAGDPLFSEYKRIIGPFHRMPGEILGGTASIVCWVLPITRATRESNRPETQWPSREWALTRHHGEIFNNALRRHVVAWLEARGHRAVAPQLAEGWRQLEDPAVGVASTWSERHAAYAAGLGTFSLNDALITPRGIAHRLGSVITDLLLSPTPRTAPDHRHNCLWYREGSCGACIGRCPAGALSRQGHDKGRCRDYVYGAVPDAMGERYGVANTGCGLCQTRVPCEGAVPRGSS
ncbi:epoxyqueuosine reductase [Geobacter sp.]|uniref:epoxyqueuosine reductase n=1 Tax=Geobacter sp. TaxID=46610 RepID=UPI00260E110A|nr:epoxyqueuosine reductase [Geobacter sp.]